MLGNTDPARVVVAGAPPARGWCSLLLSAAEADLPLPAGAVLICPTIDPTGGGIPIDPLVAPLLADLTGLLPLLVQAGAGDLASTDARRLADHARATR